MVYAIKARHPDNAAPSFSRPNTSLLAGGVLAGLILLLLAATARAEKLIATLSDTDIAITANFAGKDLTLFGAIERDHATVARASSYEMIIVTRGPDEGIVARRKDRIAGIWINNRSQTYPAIPSFYDIQSTGPVKDISIGPLLIKHQIGLNYLALPQLKDQAREGDLFFDTALLRLKREQNLYGENEKGVQFLGQSIFRATIRLPENVPDGPFKSTVYLFNDGALLATKELSFTIRKIGFEAFMYSLAHHQPFIYGIATVLLALFTGWLGGVLFRRN